MYKSFNISRELKKKKRTEDIGTVSEGLIY